MASSHKNESFSEKSSKITAAVSYRMVSFNIFKYEACVILLYNDGLLLDLLFGRFFQ
jgi:hypothetical protein